MTNLRQVREKTDTLIQIKVMAVLPTIAHWRSIRAVECRIGRITSSDLPNVTSPDAGVAAGNERKVTRYSSGYVQFM